MTRTASHVDTIAGLIEDLQQEKKQALLALSVVILFGAVTTAAIIMLQCELNYLLLFILGLGITAMGACYGVDSLARMRSLKRQIEIIHEDTKL